MRTVVSSPFRRAKWDIVTWYSPPIFFGPLIWKLRRNSGARTYLILRDIFPEWAVDLGLVRKGPVYLVFKAIAAFQYAVSEVIGVQTPSNLVYLANWASPDGWLAFHLSLSGKPMTSSLTRGLPNRDICCELSTVRTL